MPLDTSDFPYEVQVAFFIFSLLADRWDGSSGSYLGKDWCNLEHIFRAYSVEEPKVIIYLIKIIENTYIEQRADELHNQRKAEERKTQQASGKTFTHNVKG